MHIELRPRITARFGDLDPAHPTPHTGVDVALPIGSNLYAPEPGIVSRIADYGDVSLGKAVFVKTATGYHYVLGHLSAVNVTPGQRIHTGDLLALSGSTGNSTGPHLHLGLIDRSGHFADPDGLVGRVVKKSAESLMESMEHKAYDITLGILAGLRDLIVDLSYSVALIGGGLTIIFHVAGWPDGKRWAGVLTVAYVLIKYLLA